jgi:hypothetical protein
METGNRQDLEKQDFYFARKKQLENISYSSEFLSFLFAITARIKYRSGLNQGLELMERT